MRHLYLWIAAAAATMAITACGASAPAPVKAPPRAVDVETRVTPGPRRRDLPPPLVAPPPAYGNKIVMAQRDTTPSVN
jgi:predicted small lipoprotein YifL